MLESIESSARNVALWPRMLELQLENVGPWTHICPIYSSASHRLRVLGAFFGGGLRHGEQCLYFADPHQALELTEYLRAQDPIARADLDRGAMVAVTTRDQYLRAGRFEPQAMFELQDAMMTRARSSGFAALRIACEMNWVLGADIGTERFLEYEALLNSTPRTSGRSIVCQYDRRRSPPPVIRDALRAHPVAIIGERVHDNPYYEPFNLVLGKGDEERAEADWMVRRLEALTRRELALFDLGRLIQEGGSPVDAMRAAPDLIAAGLELDSVQLFELVPLGDAVRLIGSSGVDGPALGSVERLEPTSIFADVALRAGHPVVIYGQPETRLKFDQRGPRRDASGGSSFGIVISVGRGEQPHGFISAHCAEPRIFSDDEILFLEAVGHLLACAFAAARNAPTLRALVENAPDIIVRFNGDLRIVYANSSVERLTGTAAGSLIGKTSADLGILAPLVPRWELLLGQVLRTGREQAFELTVPTPTAERVFQSLIVPEPGPDGSVQSLLTVSRDVTEQRSAQADRAALYQQLVAQQGRLQELLMGRLAQDRGPAVEYIAPASRAEHLTERDRHILRLLATGYTNREIAREIGLTVGTVKNQVARILSKLNVTDRTQAAVRAVALGLVESTE